MYIGYNCRHRILHDSAHGSIVPHDVTGPHDVMSGSRSAARRKGPLPLLTPWTATVSRNRGASSLPQTAAPPPPIPTPPAGARRGPVAPAGAGAGTDGRGRAGSVLTSRCSRGRSPSCNHTGGSRGWRRASCLRTSQTRAQNAKCGANQQIYIKSGKFISNL